MAAWLWGGALLLRKVFIHLLKVFPRESESVDGTGVRRVGPDVFLNSFQVSTPTGDKIQRYFCLHIDVFFEENAPYPPGPGAVKLT